MFLADESDPQPIEGQCSVEEFQAAIAAIEQQDTLTLERMIRSYGSDMVNWKSSTSQSLLHYAVRHEKLISLKFLVENRANVHVHDKVLNSVFHYGARFQSVTCMKYLLKLLKQLAKNDLNDLTLERGDLEVARSLLDDPAVDGRTPLHYAATHRDPKVVIMILRTLYLLFSPEDFVTVASRLDCQFHTAAHVACRYKRVDVLRVFIDPHECHRVIGGRKSVCKALVREIHNKLQTPDLVGRSLNPNRKPEVRPKLVERTSSLRVPMMALRKVVSKTNKETADVMIKLRQENDYLTYQLERLRFELEDQKKLLKAKEAEHQSCSKDDKKLVPTEQLPEPVQENIPKKKSHQGFEFPVCRIQASILEEYWQIGPPADLSIVSKQFNSSELKSIHNFSPLSSIVNSDSSFLSEP
ncbi:unnamed protein product [Bursaphelenchus okinawaensis]|uniref:ANK_REP_REGION domain-containing protein n=1 Tax=Bursaphelenchus okinawaensis TaxID=465554 RepID=A0A811L8L6_9BILA|nr:unnamed protein product [Bursaphelenchus okinawaensis]CAG9118345.1 unnamed protein product [Bursaphelenchus okinawaensis]